MHLWSWPQQRRLSHESMSTTRGRGCSRCGSAPRPQRGHGHGHGQGLTGCRPHGAAARSGTVLHTTWRLDAGGQRRELCSLDVYGGSRGGGGGWSSGPIRSTQRRVNEERTRPHVGLWVVHHDAQYEHHRPHDIAPSTSTSSLASDPRLHQGSVFAAEAYLHLTSRGSGHTLHLLICCTPLPPSKHCGPAYGFSLGEARYATLLPHAVRAKGGFHRERVHGAPFRGLVPCAAIDGYETPSRHSTLLTGRLLE